MSTFGTSTSKPWKKSVERVLSPSKRAARLMRDQDHQKDAVRSRVHQPVFRDMKSQGVEFENQLSCWARRRSARCTSLEAAAWSRRLFIVAEDVDGCYQGWGW